MKLPDGGKLVAWTGFIFGTVVSVAANVLAARIPPDHATAGWEPRLDTQLGSAVWPLALLLSIEVLARVAWPKGIAWSLARFGGLTIVAAGAFVISYQHINHVLASWGYEWLSQGVGPLVIDGLMIICGVAMLSKPGTLRKLLTGKEAANYTEVGEPEATAPVSIAKNITIPKTAFDPPQPDMAQVAGEQNQRAADEWDGRQLQDAVFGPVPAQRTNGHRVSAALKAGPPKSPARRKTSGRTDEEIAAVLRAEIDRGESPDLTKRGVMQRFSIGAPRWTKINEMLKKEES